MIIGNKAIGFFLLSLTDFCSIYLSNLCLAIFCRFAEKTSSKKSPKVCQTVAVTWSRVTAGSTKKISRVFRGYSAGDQSIFAGPIESIFKEICANQGRSVTWGLKKWFKHDKLYFRFKKRKYVLCLGQPALTYTKWIQQPTKKSQSNS